MEWSARADGFEEAGNYVDLDVFLPECAHESEHLLVVVPRERDDHPVDVRAPDDLADLVRLPEQFGRLQIAAHLLRRRVDEPQQVDPVLGVVEQLAPDQLPDVTRADDHRVLDVGRIAARQPARDRTQSGDADERQEPERRQLRLVRMGEPDEPRGREEEPEADGDQMEDADYLVCRGVRGTRFVAVIEAVELRDHGPEREQEQKHHPAEGEIGAPRGLVTEEDQLRRRESDEQANHVRGEEHPPHEPATAHAARSGVSRGFRPRRELRRVTGSGRAEGRGDVLQGRLERARRRRGFRAHGSHALGMSERKDGPQCLPPSEKAPVYAGCPDASPLLSHSNPSP